MAYFDPNEANRRPQTTGLPPNAVNQMLHTMDDSNSQYNYFQPITIKVNNLPNQNNENNGPDDDEPLLKELGVDFEVIQTNIRSIFHPFSSTSSNSSVLSEQDLAGPLVFCLLYGCCLLLGGKLHFNYVYGISTIGSFGIYLLLQLMVDPHRSNDKVTFVGVASVLGYSLLPIVLLSAIGIMINLKGLLGLIISLISVIWCAISSSRLFVDSCQQLQTKRLLVAYPCLLLYAVFALIAIF
ncbi:hypothetical protein SNEBB_004355 [Seison nebaliae]|nr:hypothetical protein SNEBB_004355 [Seison nebaliae]